MQSPPDDRLQGTCLPCHVTGLVDEFRVDSFRNTHSSSEHLPTDGDEEIGSVLAVSTFLFTVAKSLSLCFTSVVIFLNCWHLQSLSFIFYDFAVICHVI